MVRHHRTYNNLLDIVVPNAVVVVIISGLVSQILSGTIKYSPRIRPNSDFDTFLKGQRMKCKNRLGNTEKIILKQEPINNNLES